MASAGHDAVVRDAVVGMTFSRCIELTRDTFDRFKRSSLFLNGALLVVAGFLGIWSALSLNLQGSIISCYVMVFGARAALPGRVAALVPRRVCRAGVILCRFAMGLGDETLRAYFGFMCTANGQLLFLAVAGNLAWCTGWVGILVAIFTNVHAGLAWWTGRKEDLGAAGVPTWRT